MWGSRGVGGDVADLENLGSECRAGCDERGGAGTLACGNGAQNSFATETALFDDVHSTERFGAREQRRHVALVQKSQFPEDDNEHAMGSGRGGQPPAPHPPSQGKLYFV